MFRKKIFFSRSYRCFYIFLTKFNVFKAFQAKRRQKHVCGQNVKGHLKIFGKMMSNKLQNFFGHNIDPKRYQKSIRYSLRQLAPEKSTFFLVPQSIVIMSPTTSKDL